SAASIVGPALLAARDGGPEPTRRGNRADGCCPSGVFPCRGDDEWCALAVRSDAEWRALVRVLGIDDDRRLATLAGRLEHEEEIEAAVAARTAVWDRRELTNALQAARVPA